MAKTLIDTAYDGTVDGSVCEVDITSGIDDTYDVYEFHFVNMHPASNTSFTFQFDTGDLENYNQPITSTFFLTYHREDGSSADVGYHAAYDQANAAQAFQTLIAGGGISTDADSGVSGTLTLYAPSSAYVKHFMGGSNSFQGDPQFQQTYVAGYVNTTTALTRIRFKMDSGNIDAGVIKMYGLAKS